MSAVKTCSVSSFRASQEYQQLVHNLISVLSGFCSLCKSVLSIINTPQLSHVCSLQVGHSTPPPA